MLIDFQTINVSENSESKDGRGMNLKLIYLKKQKKIMIYGSKIMFFENDKSLNPELADDQIIFCCHFDRISKSLYSFSLRKIKIWNPFTGKIRKVYEDPMENEITALVLDKNLKRIFLGDNLGNIKCFNMKTGKVLKILESHYAEINILCHSQHLEVLISCSVDNILKIHQDIDILETRVLKEINLHSNPAKCLGLMDNHYRIIMGMINGQIRFYDISHYRYDSDLTSDNIIFNDELSCMYYFDNRDLLISCHLSGINKFIITPPNGMKFLSCFEFYNYDPKDEKNYIPITCVQFDYEKNRLITGDHLGNISCWDLNDLFRILKITGLNDARK
jgi:WD40 repeat protein